MKKRDREDDDDNHQHYSSTDIHPEVHTFAVKLFNALQSRGIEKKVFLLSMKEAGYFMSERTFNRHIAKAEVDGNALSINKQSGAISSLSFDQKLIGAGNVFHENAQNHEFHEKDRRDSMWSNTFAFSSFEIIIFLRCTHVYLSTGKF